MIAPEEYEYDPIQELKDVEPGTVIYGLSREDDPTVEFLVREHSELIQMIGEEVQMRAGIVTERGIPVPVVLFHLPPNPSIYRTFWNYHHPVESPEDGHIFEHMAYGSNELAIKFIGDRAEIERILVLRHPLAPFFKNAMEQIEPVKPWTSDQFFDALDEIAKQNIGASELWDAFTGGSQI